MDENKLIEQPQEVIIKDTPPLIEPTHIDIAEIVDGELFKIQKIEPSLPTIEPPQSPEINI